MDRTSLNAMRSPSAAATAVVILVSASAASSESHSQLPCLVHTGRRLLEWQAQGVHDVPVLYARVNRKLLRQQLPLRRVLW